MQLSKNRFVLLWLSSAAIVTVVRALNAADLGYDFPAHLQAAQHSLTGKGLSIYSWEGEDDLARPSRLFTLSHFPAGYSIWAAALIAMGLSVGTVVKVAGAAGTILGWWGWGKLAYSFFSDGLKRGCGWRWAGYAIAVSTPLLFTPPWQGTDIFLWAAIPWILMWIVSASGEETPYRRWFDGLAGLICGLCFLMRYAGMFLVLYAGFLILCQSKAPLKMLSVRWAVFAAGLLPCFAFQIWVNNSNINPEPATGEINFRGVRAALEHLWDGLQWLTRANFPAVWWMPHQVVNFLTQPGTQAPWLVCLTVAGLALVPLLFVMRFGSGKLAAASRDVRIAAVGLFVALPLFLLAWTSVTDYLYVAEQRSYIPLLPLAVFVAYAFAAAGREREGKLETLVRRISFGYLMAYLCVAAIWIALLPLPTKSGFGKRTKVMGTFHFQHWPSMKVNYEFSSARGYVVGLFKDKPGTVLVTNHDEWFYADPTLDRSRIRRLKEMRATYVSGPAYILIAVEDFSAGPVREVSWYTHYDRVLKGDYFQHLPDLRLVRRFPEENIRILEAWIPDGVRIDLNKETAEVERR